MTRSLAPRCAPALLAAVLLAGCSSLPAVLTATDDSVAVEFEKDGSLIEPSKLAGKECAKYGKQAKFDEVDATATPKTRIAKFQCVSDVAAPGAAQSD